MLNVLDCYHVAQLGRLIGRQDVHEGSLGEGETGLVLVATAEPWLDAHEGTTAVAR